MDMKKKLEDAYLSDSTARKEKVVLGLFGLDSMVTAYLLKIQKYDVLAVTVVNSWDDYSGEQKKSLSCHLSPSRLEEIREFCHKLNLPLLVVKIPGEFRENVIETWISDKIQGKRPLHCWNCHELRMRILFEKMQESGAKYLATGHYAKIFHHESRHTVYVHTSSDEEHDQSGLLSRLPHDILSSLILPLSDLTRKEVLKLAQNFGVTEEPREVRMHECLRDNPELIQYLEKRIPARFRREGDFVSIDETISFGTHPGVFHFTAGAEIPPRELGSSMRGVFSHYSPRDHKIVVATADYFLRKKIMLFNCHFSEEVSWLEPFSGYVILSDNTYVECWIIPKTLYSVSIEFAEKNHVIPGEILSVVKKRGKNSKLFLTGEVQLIAEETEEIEGEPDATSADIILDF